MKENIEESIKVLEEQKEKYEFLISCKEERLPVDEMLERRIQAIENILSDYKRVLKENEELKEDIKEYEKTFDIFNRRTYRKKYLEERRAEQPDLLFPDADEIYKRYYELKEENEILEAVKDEAIRRYNFETISKQKVKNKIEELEKEIQELSDEQGYWGDNELLIKLETLQEVLEEE